MVIRNVISIFAIVVSIFLKFNLKQSAVGTFYTALPKGQFFFLIKWNTVHGSIRLKCIALESLLNILKQVIQIQNQFFWYVVYTFFVNTYCNPELHGHFKQTLLNLIEMNNGAKEPSRSVLLLTKFMHKRVQCCNECTKLMTVY